MKLKKIGHIGIVVKDADAACDRFSEIFGIKKWYEVNIEDLEMFYEGKKVDTDMRIILGGKGFTKIELIQTRGAKNAYSEVLERNPDGDVHHFMYNVRNLEKAIISLEQDGMRVVQHGSYKAGTANVSFAYLTGGGYGGLIELVNTTTAGGVTKGDLIAEMQLLGRLTKSYKRIK
jgi:catechol 2,3-dioxygenase-like lactoylglutathione lyase family enzyme